jgi:hypothetical protein
LMRVPSLDFFCTFRSRGHAVPYRRSSPLLPGRSMHGPTYGTSQPHPTTHNLATHHAHHGRLRSACTTTTCSINLAHPLPPSIGRPQTALLTGAGGGAVRTSETRRPACQIWASTRTQSQSWQT